MAGVSDNILQELENGNVNALFDDLKQSDPEAYAANIESARKTAEKLQKQNDRAERREANRGKVAEFFNSLFGTVNTNTNTNTVQQATPDYTKYLIIGGVVLLVVMLLKK